MDNNDLSYLTINHKSTFREKDKEEQRMETLRLFTTLSSIEEDIIGNNVNQFFNEILPENNTSEDILSICKSIASNKELVSSINKETIANRFDVLMNKTFSMVFTFNKSEINDLYIVLIGVYRIIKSKYNSIASFSDLVSLCKTFNMSNNKKTILKQFRIANPNLNGNGNGNGNDDLNGSDLDIITTTSVPNGTISLPYSNRKDSNISKTKSIGSSSSNQYDQSLYRYQYKETKVIQYALPIEVMILMLKFEQVRQLKFSVKDIDDKLVRQSILILFNMEWLFSNAIEIEVDLSHETIYRDMEKYYGIKLAEIAKLSKKMVKNTNYDSGYKTNRMFRPSYEAKAFRSFNHNNGDDNNNGNDYGNGYNGNGDDGNDFDSNGDNGSQYDANLLDDEYINIHQLKPSSPISSLSSSITREIGSYNDIIQKHKAVFEMTIIYSYFLSQMTNTYIMRIILPDCFKREVMNTLKERSISLFNYHFFSFLTNFTSLIQLTCDINSLDSATFEKCIGLIYKNQSLKTLHLSLFPPEEYFSPEMLLKLVSSMGFNYNSIFPKKVSKLNTDVAINEDMDTMILNKLIDSFEINIQTLFSLIEQKDSLSEFVLLLDLPSLIFNNESYTMVLMKLIFNLLIFLSAPQCNFNTFSILTPFFRFDNRKYPIISSFFDKISLHQCKISKVKRYTIQATFFSVFNLYRLIPANVRVLALGELDPVSFTQLISNITSIELKETYASLYTIKLSLSKTIIGFNEEMKGSIMRLLTAYPRSVKEVCLFTWIRITEEEFEEMLAGINGNSLEKCQFQFCNKNIVNDLNKDWKCYYVNRTVKGVWRVIRVLREMSKVNKGVMHRRIYERIDRFINKKEKKEIVITYKSTL